MTLLMSRFSTKILEAREQIDWECRRVGLRLMRLREFKALKKQHGKFRTSDPSYAPSDDSSDTFSDDHSHCPSYGASDQKIPTLI